MKKLAAFAAAALLGIALSLSTAAAFQFPWNSPSQPNKIAKNPSAQIIDQSHKPAPAGAPEPNERAIALPSWAPLVKRVMPTVVNVAITQEVKTTEFGEGGQGPDNESGQNGPGNPFGFGGPFGNNGPFQGFQYFFGPQEPRQFKEHGIGSGVIVSPDGYILTNYHVVGHADEINVTLMDKREFTAKVIGKDQKTDLALIKIDTKQPLPYASLGDSHKVEVGDWVVAIGNPFGFNLTVTAGIVSAKGRALGGSYDNFIQTDASINPGNSGGPLFNTNGQVIGINTAIYSSTGSNAGIGFAIPIDLAKSVMDQLKAHGHVTRGWLGVEVQAMTPELAKSFGLQTPTGALVAGVQNDTPAAEAGVKRGDIIVKFDGNAVHDEHELPEMVAQTSIGKTVPLEVVRDGKHLILHVKVGELHEREVASAQGSGHPAAKWGLAVQTLTPQIAQELGIRKDQGVVISGVLPDSVAADAGLQTGDIILRINHEKLASARQFVHIARDLERHEGSALLLVQRGDRTLYTVINPKA
ncbi:MAG TPA: DegQ family serine endoprotease [Candidatus Binataceae bacterium]|nr:DegQ family serine endoprotease [Candidatus Binataceae bacterium]